MKVEKKKNDSSQKKKVKEKDSNEKPSGHQIPKKLLEPLSTICKEVLGWWPRYYQGLPSAFEIDAMANSCLRLATEGLRQSSTATLGGDRPRLVPRHAVAPGEVAYVCSGSAASLSLLNVVSLATGPDGSVYVGDYNLIRRIHPAGSVETILQFR